MIDPILSSISAILREDFRIEREVSRDSLLCFDLGVCDDEFQDFLLRVEERFGLQLEKPCKVPFSESSASVEEVANWIRSFIEQ